MHQAEKAGIPSEIKECFKVPNEIRQDYPDDIYISYGSTPDGAWGKVGKAAEQKGLIKKH